MKKLDINQLQSS